MVTGGCGLFNSCCIIASACLLTFALPVVMLRHFVNDNFFMQ